MSAIIQQKSAIAQSGDGNIDVREQLFNQGECGPIRLVSRKIEEITCLNGILFDIDPSLYKSSCLVSDPQASAAEFYEETVSRWLQGHSVLKNVEVRCSGRGLHVILWLDKPLKLDDQLDRARWAARVRVIQSILPIDPNQPGINAMTRKLGSVNGKNQAVVKQLRAGVGVTEAELLSLIDDICKKPFRALAGVLVGTDSYIECPLCSNRSLEVQDRQGRCYACKRVSTERLLRLVYAGKDVKAKEVANGE